MFSPLVHAGRMDQWTIYEMGVMDIGHHGSHTMWAKPSNLRQGASPKTVWKILPFWQLWTQFGLSPRRVAWRSLGAKCMGVFVGLPVDRVWNGGSDLQAGVEIYYSGHARFWLILSSQNDPLLGPQFHPPVWSIGGPISLCQQEAWTQFQVVHSDIGPRSCLLSCGSLAVPWPGEPRAGMMPILVILAS